MEIDASELRAYAAQLERAGDIIDVEQVISKGALNIKNQLQSEARGSRHFRGFAPGISYDIRGGSAFGGGFVEAEIGPERGAPGSLANIAYFGTWKGGGTVPDPEGALEAEAPNVERYLGEQAAKALE